MPDGGLRLEPGPRFAWAGSALEFTPAGELLSLGGPVPGDEAETSWLTGGGAVRARVGGRAVEWSAPEPTADVDELEIAHRSGPVSAVVRHSFGPAWTVRLALSNSRPDTVRLDDLHLTWAAAADRPTWVLAAGAATAYAVFGAGGRVLGGVLTRGEVVAVTHEGFDLGAIVLEPGARYVAQWDWCWFASARAFAAHRRRQRVDRHVPTSLVRPAGEVALITVNPDEAVVLPPGLAGQTVADQLELAASAPGTYPVEVRSLAGVTRYDLRWAPPLQRVLLAAAARALAGPRNGAGVVVLVDVAVAQVVQAALRLGCDDAEAGEEALDLFTTRVLQRPGSDPRLATYLCGEYDRTGEVDLVDAAAGVVSAAARFRPGLGLATGHLALARLVAGRPQDPSAHPGRLEPVPGLEPVERAAARLEAALAGGPDPYAALAGLGPWLGAGLTGSSLTPQHPAARAYATAVLAAVPDDIVGEVQRSWAATAVDLGRWTEAEVLADLADAPVGPAHAWLAVAARTR
jgi:hypothetical protein